MKVLFKNAKIIDRNSRFHLQHCDVLLENGQISKIAKTIKQEANHVIKSKNLHLSPGWIDIGTMLNDPGNEQRETFETLVRVARKSGYTCLAPFPMTEPTIQNKSDVNFLMSRSGNHHIMIEPIAALSAAREGKDITEMIDLNQHGVKIFSDGMRSINNAELLERALLYSQQFNGTIIHYSNDKSLRGDGQMHQGVMSTKLGFHGSPDVAEEVSVKRDISILKEIGGRLIIHTISSQKSLNDIKSAKKAGLDLLSTVSFQNLTDTDESLINFDSNRKLNPPLRRPTDQKALLKGLVDDTIDAIVSNHTPLEEELKKLEYPYATAGSLGLETVFSVMNDRSQLSLELLIDKLSYGPAKCLGRELRPMAEGQEVNLTFFDPDESFEYSRSGSNSQNSSHLGKVFKGKVLGSVLKSDLIFN